MSEHILSRKRLSVKVQVLAGFIAVISAVALPQLFHLMGRISGLGTALGEAFLPMHLPIILAGLLCGPFAAGAAGAAAPLLSFLLTGMPNVVMLPFMCVELCVYGVAAGILRGVKLPGIVKVIIAQIAGRAVRAVAILIGANLLGSSIQVSVIWTSIAAGVFGIALQWALIPLIMARLKTDD